MRGSSPTALSDPSSATTNPSAGSASIANGLTAAKTARRPSSSRRPCDPLPAAVPIVPSPNTRHTRATHQSPTSPPPVPHQSPPPVPHQSPTSTLPSAATATERGQTAARDAPPRTSAPSGSSPSPLLCSIRPPGATRRTRRFSKSATTIAASATPRGQKRRASVTGPPSPRSHAAEVPVRDGLRPAWRWSRPARPGAAGCGALGDHEPAVRQRGYIGRRDPRRECRATVARESRSTRAGDRPNPALWSTRRTRPASAIRKPPSASAATAASGPTPAAVAGPFWGLRPAGRYPATV